MNQQQIRKRFPMLQNNITYLDSAALVQKPDSVIKAIIDFYTKYSISNRTSDSKIGTIVGQKIEKTREMIAELLKCDSEEVMFNSGTTEGLNYAAQLLEQMLKKDDEIIISKYNHSSHMIPWIEIAKRKGAKIVFSDNLISDINKKTKIIAFTQTNNTFDIKIDITKLYLKARKHQAYVVNDAAQAISHESVDGRYADIIAFSGNKFFGPTGIGILYVSDEILSKTNPKKYGGGAIDFIKANGRWKSKNSIAKHEPGTLNLAGIFGLYEAINFFNSLDKNWMTNYLKELSDYAYEKLIKIKDIKIHSKKGASILLFEIKNVPSQDVASYLGYNEIYVRNGYFCAQYLDHMIKNPLVRVSLHVYNNTRDIDKLFECLNKAKSFIQID